jgi:hypothetical protein
VTATATPTPGPLGRPLLVGEANPYGADPEFALYPSPPGCAGDRLCRLVMGLDPDDYLERFDRTNLCPGRWAARQARATAGGIRAARKGGGLVVLLGAKVCAAFGLEFRPFTTIWRHTDLGPADVCGAILPHPSGLSRAWGRPGAFERARAVLREAGVLPSPNTERSDSTADHLEVRHVLAGAYPKSERFDGTGSLLRHAVVCDGSGRAKRVLCGRVRLDSLADVGATEPGEQATCPRCVAALKRAET